jgi:hypothetical protein
MEIKMGSSLCPKCGHDRALHRREVEAVVLNIEKHNETTAVLECEAREGSRLCGCRYVDRALYDRDPVV